MSILAEKFSILVISHCLSQTLKAYNSINSSTIIFQIHFSHIRFENYLFESKSNQMIFFDPLDWCPVTPRVQNWPKCWPNLQTIIINSIVFFWKSNSHQNKCGFPPKSIHLRIILQGRWCSGSTSLERGHRV